MAAEHDEAALSRELAGAVTAEQADTPRRCFICLTDQEPSDSLDSWVDPCPCTLEAHQDCMLSWVLDCERTSKPLLCPVCKSTIEMEGPWDLLVTLNDLIQKRFTKASPYMLFTGFAMGVQFSLQMYGAMAMWSFAGKKTMMRFLLGPGMVLDARNEGAGVRLVRDRIWSSLVMMNVAPTLLLGRLFPYSSSRIFLPAASLYGMYQSLHDDTFFAWPPSPQLVVTVFPYIRSVYYILWREFVLPYENKLNRQILGLPPLLPAPPNHDARQDANQERRPQQNGGGGFAGLLQGILDALDPEDDDDDVDADGLNHIGLLNGDEHHNGQGEGGEIMFELRIEEVHAGADGVGGEQEGDNGLQVGLEAVRANPGDGGHAGPGRLRDEADVEGDALDPADAPGQPHPGPAGDVEAAGDDQVQVEHEAPQAPPARRLGLGGLLSSISNSVVSALILPGICFAMGEALRLVLPRSWTAPASRGSWTMLMGPGGRPGLLQQQWGRSLIGGCIFVVLKDALRVYAKSRRVTAMSNRRVKNVDRRRRERSEG
ncbi:hypothetical protein E4U42_005107 [Claviceps africana]|uniref:RING-CH-type domain-containing protein n=1 Tax=Claviceps africana TaxID=83212 RepID=A0A8K0JEF5_9HYPO|nr:hypothetical protein E4U42_005107 [Claviceps africana]